jgi:hypothetical protein
MSVVSSRQQREMLDIDVKDKSSFTINSKTSADHDISLMIALLQDKQQLIGELEIKIQELTHKIESKEEEINGLENYFTFMEKELDKKGRRAVKRFKSDHSVHSSHASKFE